MSTSSDFQSFRRGGTLLRALATAFVLLAAAGVAPAQVRIHLVDGRVIEVDEAREDAEGVWYRRGGITEQIDRARVRRVERTDAAPSAATPARPEAVTAAAPATQAPPPARLLVHLVGGARLEVDEVTESAEGFWYRRGNLSMLLDRARVERVEREEPPADPVAASARAARPYGWSTGRDNLDALIRQNGARYGVDPYLIFLVMEHESHFNPRAVSPAGARGLMQLMPGTARRFGVRDSFDPVQNISAGTRYLKELLGMFGGRVDLALASYNAGEGAVMRYGNQVPPYRETRNYVKRIGERYGKHDTKIPTAKTEGATP
jgi:soluble lytic murein transglycosylase-like protein